MLSLGGMKVLGAGIANDRSIAYGDQRAMRAQGADLAHDYEVVMHGRYLLHPCSSRLLRILPPEGVHVDDARRPFIIVIDPRAGQPVCFVAFGRLPKPVVTGNCQGGWATLLPAPGPYEMTIEEVQGEGQERRVTASRVERRFDDIRDIRAHDDAFGDERPFAAVARTSGVQAQFYEQLVRPAIRAVVTPSLAEAGRAHETITPEWRP